MKNSFTPDRVYSTPASIEAFCLAVADRRKWLRGEAPEPHLEEPLTGEATAVHRVLPCTRAPNGSFKYTFDRGYDQGYRAGYAAGVRAAAEDTEPR